MALERSPSQLSLLVPDGSLGAQDLLAENCTYSGWLRKMHRSQKLPKPSWHQKYVVLHKGCIYCYPHEVAPVASTYLSLYGYNYVKRSVDSPKTSDRPWVFFLEPANEENRPVYFSAGSEREMKEWMKYIKIEMLRANGKQSDVGILEDIKRVEEKIYQDVNEIWSKLEDPEMEEEYSDHEEDLPKRKAGPVTLGSLKAGALAASSLVAETQPPASLGELPPLPQEASSPPQSGRFGLPSVTNGQRPDKLPENDENSPSPGGSNTSASSSSTTPTSSDHVHYMFGSPEAPPPTGRRRGVLMGAIETSRGAHERKYRTGGSVRFSDSPLLKTPPLTGNRPRAQKNLDGNGDAPVGILRTTPPTAATPPPASPELPPVSSSEAPPLQSNGQAHLASAKSSEGVTLGSDVSSKKVPPETIWDAAFYTGNNESALRDLQKIGMNGVYLIRKSSQQPGENTLVFWEDKASRKYKIYEENGKLYLFDTLRFSSIEELLVHYSHYVIPGSTIKLTEPLKAARKRLLDQGSHPAPFGSARVFDPTTGRSLPPGFSTSGLVASSKPLPLGLGVKKAPPARVQPARAGGVVVPNPGSAMRPPVGAVLPPSSVVYAPGSLAHKPGSVGRTRISGSISQAHNPNSAPFAHYSLPVRR